MTLTTQTRWVPARHSPADAMPPFALPAEHFAAGLAWLALGAVGLLVVAPDLARGGFLDPRVVAVTHCFTLGWITTSILGALYQLYPVAMGVAARSVAVGHATFWVLLAGVALVVGGSWFWQPALLAAGWVALFVAVGGQSWNVLSRRRIATRGRTIGLYVSTGHMGLGLAMFVVAARIGTDLGWWRVERLGVLSAHAHLAAVGFATLTVIGVGSKLFPTFLLSRNYREWPLRWIGPLVFGGVVALGVGQLVTIRWLVVSGGLVTAAGLALYLVLAGDYFRTRTRARLEPALAHSAAALGFLAAATVVGVALLIGGGVRARAISAYAILGILGWLTLLVVGMYYKILPFLTWLHRYSPRVGEAEIPKVADLLRPELVWGTLVMLPAGVALLALGVALGKTAGAMLGAALFASGVGLVVGQYVHLALAK